MINKKIKVKQLTKGKVYAVTITPKDKTREVKLYITECPRCGNIYYTKNIAKDFICSQCSEEMKDEFRRHIDDIRDRSPFDNNKEDTATNKEDTATATPEEVVKHEKRKGSFGKKMNICGRQVIYKNECPRFEEKYEWLRTHSTSVICNKNIATNLMGILARGYKSIKTISEKLGYCETTTKHYLWDLDRCGLVIKVGNAYMISPAVKCEVR